MSDNIIIDDTLNFSDVKKSTSVGEYKYQMITPISSGGSAPTLSLTSNTPVTIEIPAKVVNLSRSYISFNSLSIAPTDTKFTNTCGTGQPWISSISLQTRTGEYLCNITQAQNFFFATSLPCRLNDDYLSTDVTTGTIQTTANIVDTFNGVSRTSLSNPTPLKQIAAGAGNQAQAIKHVIRFSDLFHTIFAINKSIPLNQILTITLTLSYANGVVYKSTSAIDGETSGIAVASAPSISELNLYLACETNQSVIDGLYSKLNNGGVSLNIPYVYSWRNSNNATDVTNQIRLYNAMGNSVLRIYNTFMNSTENFALKYVPNALNYLRTYLNNSPIQDSDMDKYQIYIQQKDLFKNTAMMSSSIFNSWQVYIDNFSKFKPYEGKDGDLISDGKPLTNELLYSVRRQASTATDVSFIHAVLQRNITIGTTEIMIR